MKDLGPMPEPRTEDPELYPGGVDAIDDPKYGETPGPPTIPDLHPDDNPTVEDAVPEAVQAEDDKTQEPDTGTSGEDDVAEEPES